MLLEFYQIFFPGVDMVCTITPFSPGSCKQNQNQNKTKNTTVLWNEHAYISIFWGHWSGKNLSQFRVLSNIRKNDHRPMIGRCQYHHSKYTQTALLYTVQWTVHSLFSMRWSSYNLTCFSGVLSSRLLEALCIVQTSHIVTHLATRWNHQWKISKLSSTSIKQEEFSCHSSLPCPLSLDLKRCN